MIPRLSIAETHGAQRDLGHGLGSLCVPQGDMRGLYRFCLEMRRVLCYS